MERQIGFLIDGNFQVKDVEVDLEAERSQIQLPKTQENRGDMLMS